MPDNPPHDTPTGAPGPGEILAEKYRVERVLGSGAMGIVVAALHLELGERVALKFLLPRAADNPDVVARFAREARAAARIKSEYVARVTDVGKLANGAPYMVMEYLDGSDLAAVVHDRGPLPVRDAVEYVLQACAAVAEAHALGIIHRDLKPANLFLANRAGGSHVVKVLDFGISKVVPGRGSNESFDPLTTRTTAWLGSPLYMSPEQMTSAKNVDTRTDIWSLGAILFELMTAKPPFDAPNLPELFATILNSPPPSLEQARPDAPPGLGAVIQKCLKRSLDERYASVADLATALVPFGPRRARSVAERAVAVSEAAGLASSRGARRPLDSTFPEEMSPAYEAPAHLEAALTKPRPAAGAMASVSASTPPPRIVAGAVTGAASGPSDESGGKSRNTAVVVLLAAAALAGAAVYFAFGASEHRVRPAGDAPASAPPAASVLPTSAASSAVAGSASAPTLLEPTRVSGAATDAGTAKDAGTAMDAGTAKDAGTGKDAGASSRAAGAASEGSGGHRTPQAPQPREARSPPSPGTGTVVPNGLDVQHCFATAPDGTRTPIPCSGTE